MNEEIKTNVVNKNMELKAETTSDKNEVSSIFSCGNIVFTVIGLILLLINIPWGIGWLIGVAGVIIYPIWKKKNAEEKAARDKVFAEELAKQMAKEMNRDR